MPNLVSRADLIQAVPRLATTAAAELDRLITAASSLIEDHCRVSFGPSSITETHTADGTGVVWLRSTPIGSITSVTIGLPDNGHVLDPTTYQVDPLTGELRLYRSDAWFWPADFWSPIPFGQTFQSIRVVYTGPSTVPASIQQVCIDLISRKAAGLIANPAIKSKSMGQVSITYSDTASGGGSGLTADDRAALSRYVRYSL